MVQILNEPKFPVIDEAPGTKEIINGFRPVDWRNLALVTVLTMPLGYAAGRPLLMKPTMYGSAGISAVFGFLLGWQKSHARLMGFRENSIEVQKFGVHTSTSTASTSSTPLAASCTDS